MTRPDAARAVHEAYLAAGSDCIETNTFGANLGNLGDYDIQHRIRELSEAGARIARQAADAYTTEDQPRYVLGSIGPGTKLPTLGHTHYMMLRDACRENVAGLILGGADALIVETCQDLLQTKAEWFVAAGPVTVPRSTERAAARRVLWGRGRPSREAAMIGGVLIPRAVAVVVDWPRALVIKRFIRPTFESRSLNCWVVTRVQVHDDDQD